MRHYLEKPFTKIGLLEWLKVKTLTSSPSTTKKKKRKKAKEKWKDYIKLKSFCIAKKIISNNEMTTYRKRNNTCKPCI
jgi:hypothetical protein